MKKIFVEDIIEYINKDIDLKGWIISKRKQKRMIFFDLRDSSWIVQLVANMDDFSEKQFQKIAKIPLESSVSVYGWVCKTENQLEVKIKRIDLIGQVKKQIFPRPSSSFNIFDPQYTEQILKEKHLYLRNPRYQAIMRFKSNFIFSLHEYLIEKKFVYIDAPILTKLLLYEDSSAFLLNYNQEDKKESIFLSQCCTFQLEAAVHAFEKVYNITPSFRAEHSKSNRHLREYRHLKVELAWVDLDDLIHEAEELFYTTAVRAIQRSKAELKILWITPNIEELKPPFPSITYDDAINLLHKKWKPFLRGKSIGTKDSEIITEHFGNKLVRISGIPCSAEGFPFKRSETNKNITKAIDLISPFGFSELLGIAEKITDKQELLERMSEKNKDSKEKLNDYGWYIGLRDFWMVPHWWIGMGIERVVRYLLRIPHIRDTVSFPRLFWRTPNP